jgi:hypothetical protein
MLLIYHFERIVIGCGSGHLVYASGITCVHLVGIVAES